jgi:hypothetical protein
MGGKTGYKLKSTKGWFHGKQHTWKIHIRLWWTFSIHVGHISKHLCLFLNFSQRLLEKWGIKKSPPPTRYCKRFSLIIPFIMHSEKHSSAHYKACEIFFVTIYKHNSQFLELLIYKWLHITRMNFGNYLLKSSMWDLFETCHKCQPHTPLKVCKKLFWDYMNFVKKSHFWGFYTTQYCT